MLGHIRAMRYLWDFIYGVLLIGGAPWSILALWIVGGDLFERVTHIVMSNAVGEVMSGIVVIVAFFAFGAAVAYRVKKRVLPRWSIAAEVLFGVAGAILILGFYGVIVHSIID